MPCVKVVRAIVTEGDWNWQTAVMLLRGIIFSFIQNKKEENDI